MAEASMTVTRRRLIAGAAMAGVLAACPPGVRFAFAANGAARDVLLVVFLRGGMDGLNLVAPADDASYVAARPATLRVTDSGTGAGLALPRGPSQQSWRLNAAAAPLKDLYDSGDLAFVHATGLVADTRSHFEAQDLIEKGVTTTGALQGFSGWLGRHLVQQGAPPALGIVSAAQTVPVSLAGSPAVAIPSAGSFALSSAAAAPYLQASYGDVANLLGTAGSATLSALASFQAARAASPQSSTNPVGTSSFANALWVVAQLMNMNVGLQAATIDYGGWDTHSGQQGTFTNLATGLGAGLAAFYNTVAGQKGNLTVVVQSEFGRRLVSNASGGTDHGHGNVMTVLGGRVNGGRIYGGWPGLGTNALDHGDVPVTTDYRTVLAEILTTRRGAGDLSGVFPGLPAAAALGVVRAG